MLNKHEWLSDFANELRALARGGLDHDAQFVGAVALQEWERLCDESPGAVARRWAARSGLRGDLAHVPPPRLIWLSECAEEFQRLQPSLGHNIARALALLQWDVDCDLSPNDAALRWLGSRPHAGGSETACASRSSFG